MASLSNNIPQIARYWVYILITMLVAYGPANAQQSATFFDGVLSFELPQGWRTSDKSSNDVHQINIVPDVGNVLIIVSMYRKKVSGEYLFAELKEQVSKPRQGRIAARFANFIEEPDCARLKDRKIPGSRITGLYDQQPTTSSSYSFVQSGRFIHLLYLREDRESSNADAAWEAILQSIRVKGDNSKKGLSLLDTESDDLLNGRAISLPKPISPGSQGAYSASLRVTVRVTIDANGNVVSAKGKSSDPLYTMAAESAAMKAKFRPTLVCGEPGEISGRIDYVFQAR